jgi:hypothetical protein
MKQRCMHNVQQQVCIMLSSSDNHGSFCYRLGDRKGLTRRLPACGPPAFSLISSAVCMVQAFMGCSCDAFPPACSSSSKDQQQQWLSWALVLVLGMPGWASRLAVLGWHAAMSHISCNRWCSVQWSLLLLAGLEPAACRGQREQLAMV